jgi:hypothetical protein
MALQEREFFNERPETKPATFTRPQCRHRDDDQLRWIRRTVHVPSHQSMVFL